jgi:hypothetical protein
MNSMDITNGAPEKPCEDEGYGRAIGGILGA